MAEHVDVDQEQRSTNTETTMRPQAIVSTTPANPGIKHCN
jgi:hypothetical protein